MDSIMEKRVIIEEKLWAVNARVEKVENGAVDNRSADSFDPSVDETET
jgi:hypothetical protein